MRHSVLAGLVTVVASLAPLRAPAAQNYSTEQMAAMGRAFVEQEIKAYGRVTNAQWDKDITDILKKLQRASGYPGLRLQYVVVGDSEINAAAVPGGYMIINAGLMREFARLTAAPNQTPAARQARFTSYLAAVLGHELAHLTLGHTDSLASRMLALSNAASAPDSMLVKPAFYAAAAQDESVDLAMLGHSRERELAADRTGSLYLLRAGWSIQTAMDLMRAFDTMERDDPAFYQTVTYVRTHPRASTREAALESFRGQLKLLQANYDDALALIINNVQVPVAVQLLDTVLAYFPGMVPALHARGTAYHQLWLATVPVPTQQVRASLMTYGFHFLPLIRGEPGDMKLYARARQDYLAALTNDPLARTAVQLALLEAYAGDCGSAMKRSADAAARDTLSMDVTNNRGVVLFVCDDQAGALKAFRRVERKMAPGVVPATVFNIGRALKSAGDPSADSYFTKYLKYDNNSQWAAEARKELGITVPAAPARPAVPAARAAPTVQGIALGSSEAQVRQLLGAPTSVQSDTLLMLTYETRGISVVFSGAEGVVAISLDTRTAGSLDGVRVGDPASAARAHWGTPIEESDEYQLFKTGSWLQAVIIQGGTITTVALLAHD